MRFAASLLAICLLAVPSFAIGSDDTVVFRDDFESAEYAWGFYESPTSNDLPAGVQEITHEIVHDGKGALLGRTAQGCVDHLRFDLGVVESNSALSFWYYLSPDFTGDQIHLYVHSKTDHQRYLKILPPTKGRWTNASLHLARDVSAELIDDELAGLEINAIGKGTFVLDDVTIVNRPHASLTLESLDAPTTATLGDAIQVTARFATESPVIYELSKPMAEWNSRYTAALLATQANQPVTLEIPECAPPGTYELRLKVPGAKVNTNGNEPAATIDIKSRPRPKPQSPTVKLVRADVPPAASLGQTLTIEAELTAAAPLPDGTRVSILLKQDQVLWLVHDQDLPPIHDGRITFRAELPIPNDIPTGQYQAAVCIAAQATFDAGRLRIDDPNAAAYPILRRALGYGTFVDERQVPHFWYVNQGNALIWDGRPYLPVGGMFESRYLVSGGNPQQWAKDLHSITLLAAKGVLDTYVNPPARFGHVPTWMWQHLIDRFEDLGIRYGLELTAFGYGSPETHLDAYVVRMFEEIGGRSLDSGSGDAVHLGNFMIDNITASGVHRPAKPIEFGAAHTKIHRVNHVLYALVDRTDPALVDVGQALFRFADNKLDVAVDLTLPREGHTYTAYLVPNVTFNGPFGNYWQHGARFADAIGRHLSQLRLGPGFRFIVDPIDNEPGIYGDHAGFFFHFPEFQAEYAEWLRAKYRNIAALHEAWAVSPATPLAGFTSAANLTPLQAGPLNSPWQNRAFAWCPTSKTSHELDYATTQLWYDYLDFRHHSFMEHRNRLADAIKRVADVPIVFKRAYMDSRYAGNTRLHGGFDGVGIEDYGSGDRLTYIALEGHGRCADSMRTLWCLTTETHHEGGMHFDYVGYRSEADMVDTFSRQVAGGSKGIYHFLLSTSAGWENHALVNDPKQLDWMRTFAQHLAARADQIADYAPNVHCSWPAGGMWWRIPNDRTAFLRDDYHGGFSVEADDGTWFTATYEPLRHPGRIVLVNLENAPTTVRYGPTFEKLLADPSRQIIYAGLRRDLGALSIDSYFTDRFITIDNATAQVLTPTPTSTILHQTPNGEVWALADGRLQIVSRADLYANLGSDPEVRFVQPNAGPLTDIMHEILEYPKDTPK